MSAWTQFRDSMLQNVWLVKTPEAAGAAVGSAINTAAQPASPAPMTAEQQAAAAKIAGNQAGQVQSLIDFKSPVTWLVGLAVLAVAYKAKGG